MRSADYNAALDLFSDDLSGMGGCDQTFATKQSAVDYLKRMPFREPDRAMSWDDPAVVDTFLVCALWREVFRQSHNMPIIGSSWLLVIRLDSSRSVPLIGRFNVIENSDA